MDRKTIILNGGFECRVTEEERNQWSAYIKDRPELLEYVTAGACAQNVVKNEPSKIDLAVKRCLSARSVMFKVGRDWFEELKTQRAAEEPQEPKRKCQECKSHWTENVGTVRVNVCTLPEHKDAVTGKPGNCRQYNDDGKCLGYEEE